MRKAEVFYDDQLTGIFIEITVGKEYQFRYESSYHGPPISLTMPVRQEAYHFNDFPPFFDGLLPEGFQLEALLRRQKLDRQDKFAQLVTIGRDTVGAVTIREAP